MKAYKGFNKDMTCRGFQFEEGKAYHEDTAVLCESGFHACLDPLDCLGYYDPCDSVFHEVELDNVSEQRENDTKVVAKDIKIGSRISIKDIVKASIDFTFSSVRKENNTDCAFGDSSRQAASGDYSRQETTGKNCVMMSAGNDGRARGKIGSWIVLTEWKSRGNESIPTVVAKRIDGTEVKEDTWYTLKNGEFVEVKECNVLQSV